MKKIIFAFILLALVGCGKKEQNPSLVIEEVILKLSSNQKPPQGVNQTLLDDAQILLNRSQSNGYRLITTQELFQMLKNPIVLLDVSLKGDYLLGHIDSAKNFAFPKDALPPQGILQWSEEYGSFEKFQKKLGEDKNAMIVIYDKGDTPLYQTSPADIACMWAKKLGYHNVYRLVGGFTFWKERNYPINHEVPSCCK